MTYNPALHGQHFSFISIKTRTTEPIPLVEIIIPYKGYPEYDFFWKTHRTIDLAHTIILGGKESVIHVPVQAPVQMLFNQRYAAAKARTNENRRKRTQRANYIRNTIVGPEIGTHKYDLVHLNAYFNEKNFETDKYPANYSYANLVENLKDYIENHIANKQRKSNTRKNK